VSIIVATCNRSNVLKLAIESVFNSVYKDWELIIVDDASTDDTEQIMSQIHDSRVRYVKLPKNTGIQSGPNNEGLKIASGEYIAYLNHDDLWFPDHLEKLVAHLENTKSDFVFSQAFYIINSNTIKVTPAFPDNNYSPYLGGIPASLWLVKKEVLNQLGGWKMSNELFMAPSQDVLIRAYNAKYKITGLPSVTAVLFPSGQRPECYKMRSNEEQLAFLSEMTNPLKLKLQLYEQATNYYLITQAVNSYRLRYLLLRFMNGVLKNIGKIVHISPIYLYALLKYRRKGRFIKKLMKIRGLEK